MFQEQREREHRDRMLAEQRERERIMAEQRERERERMAMEMRERVLQVKSHKSMTKNFVLDVACGLQILSNDVAFDKQ